MNEPVADAARSILDGHCVLTRALAHRSHYPAIDVLQSVSRLEGEIVGPDGRAAASALRETLAAFKEKEDLISIGAYVRGGDRKVDYALDKQPAIEAFLRQSRDESVPASLSEQQLRELMADRELAHAPGTSLAAV